MDLFDLSGKTAVVTGGTRGIGLMIARGLLEAGARVYISSRKADACAAAERELARYGKVAAIPADLSTEAECLRLAGEIGEREQLAERAGQQRRCHLGRAARGVPRRGLGQSHRPQPEGAVLPDPGVPAAAGGRRDAGRPGAGHQRRQHRRAPGAAVADLRLLGQQGRAASPDPGAGPRTRPAADHGQRRRPGAVRVQDDGRDPPGRSATRSPRRPRCGGSAAPTTWPASRSTWPREPAPTSPAPSSPWTAASAPPSEPSPTARRGRAGQLAYPSLRRSVMKLGTSGVPRPVMLS